MPFLSDKKKSPKKKFLTILFAILLVATCVFLLVWFVFLPPKMSAAEKIAFNVRNSEEAIVLDSNFEKVFTYFTGDSSKLSVDDKTNAELVASAYQAVVTKLDSLVVENIESINDGNNLLALMTDFDYSDEKFLRKELKELRKLKKELKEKTEAVTEYFDNQLNNYVDNTAKTELSDTNYFKQLAKKTAAYLETYQGINSVLADIVLKATKNTTTNTIATKFYVKSESTYLSQSVLKIKKLYILEENVSLLSLASINSIFPQQSVLETDYSLDAENYSKFLDYVSNDWVKNYFYNLPVGTDSENDFRSTLSEAEQSQFDAMISWWRF